MFILLPSHFSGLRENRLRGRLLKGGNEVEVNGNFTDNTVSYQLISYTLHLDQEFGLFIFTQPEVLRCLVIFIKQDNENITTHTIRKGNIVTLPNALYFEDSFSLSPLFSGNCGIFQREPQNTKGRAIQAPMRTWLSKKIDGFPQRSIITFFLPLFPYVAQRSFYKLDLCLDNCLNKQFFT